MQELEHENDKSWTCSGERFVCIMDSQVVHQIICGHAGLTDETHRPVFQRVMAMLVRLVSANVLPPADISDPVQWRPRAYNVRADWLCNQALDSKSSFHFITDDVDAYRLPDLQWEAFSDGACRGDGYSSYGWIIYCTWQIGKQRHRFMVAFGYEVLAGNFSSFVTELLGLERAVQTLLQLIGQ